MAIKPDDAPENEPDSLTIDDAWSEGDLPRVEFDSLLTLPILVTHAQVTESNQPGREGSLWGTFDATLLGRTKRGLTLKASGEVIDAGIGLRFSSSSGARRVVAVLQAMAIHGFNPGYVVTPGKVTGDTSGKARMLAKVDAEEARKLVSAVPAEPD